jgi:hypothetical protein
MAPCGGPGQASGTGTPAGGDEGPAFLRGMAGLRSTRKLPPPSRPWLRPVASAVDEGRAHSKEDRRSTRWGLAGGGAVVDRGCGCV